MPSPTNTKVIRSLRKTLTLQVQPDLTLLVKAPLHIPEHEIHKFIEKNAAWIQKQTELLLQKSTSSVKQYTEGEQFLYLGKKLKLHFGNYTKIEVQNDLLLFPRALVFRAQKELDHWYMQQAKKIITHQTNLYAQQMNVSFKSIMFSDTKSKWGSCTHDNRLQFSWRLIMTPVLVMNYVIIHELVHTFEKNHSARFWSKVRLYKPSYKQQIKWLKLYGDTLSL